MRRLLFGDDGLRAGWSVLLFLVLAFLLGRAASFVHHHMHLMPKSVPEKIPTLSAGSVMVGDGIGFASFALAAFIMSLIERRPFSRYGLSLRQMPSDFLIGLFWGFTLLSALIGTLYLTHSIQFDGVLLHGTSALSFGARWALAFLCVGLLEEFATRGYIQYTVARGVAGITRAIKPASRHAHLIGFCVSALIFSVLLFMAGHIGNPGESAPGIIAVGEAGAIFAFSLYRTGTLWWAIGMHAAWDWAQTFFYGVSDSGLGGQGHLLATHPLGRSLISGGSVGPEGSIFVLPTLLMAAVIIHFTLPRRDYPLTADQQNLTADQQRPEPPLAV
jgi:membrane protease YdiL (CAAX protease family)